jgi:NADH-quinone oxidoreductase subunit N
MKEPVDNLKISLVAVIGVVFSAVLLFFRACVTGEYYNFCESVPLLLQCVIAIGVSCNVLTFFWDVFLPPEEEKVFERAFVTLVLPFWTIVAAITFTLGFFSFFYPYPDPSDIKIYAACINTREGWAFAVGAVGFFSWALSGAYYLFINCYPKYSVYGIQLLYAWYAVVFFLVLLRGFCAGECRWCTAISTAFQVLCAQFAGSPLMRVVSSSDTHTPSGSGSDTAFLIDSFFSMFWRALTNFSFENYPFLSYQSQNYFGIVIYIFIAVAICGLLASLAYLFSLSSVQDSEKRSEYECGFEPFDSATRLPFDVHFYLVGILFLIFDVEIALLFPWVVALKVTGWFSFYLVLGFIILLGVGFLYEWKRGALIWPSRQLENPYVPQGTSNNVYTRGFGTKISSLPYLVQLAKYTTVSEVKTSICSSSLYETKQFAAISRSIRRLRVERRIRNKQRIFKRLHPFSFREYLVAATYAENGLMRCKLALNYLFLAISRFASLRRSAVPVNTAVTNKKEVRLFTKLVPAAKAYAAFVRQYKTLWRRFSNSSEFVCISTKTQKTNQQSARRNKGSKRARALLAYLCLQSKYFDSFREPVEKKRNALREKLVISVGRRPGRFAVFAAISDHLSFPYQVFMHFLPETMLVFAIVVSLIVFALALGYGYSKKHMGLQALIGFKYVLDSVAFIYFGQLFCCISAPLFAVYAATSAYIVATKLLLVLTARFVLWFSRRYMSDRAHRLEYPLMLMLAIFFMLLLLSSNHLVSAFLSLVGFSLNLYVLVLFDATVAVAREAGIKYFYLSTMSSGLILYGVFIFQLATGSLSFDDLHKFLSSHNLTDESVVSVAFAFILIGLFFKLSAFPGHLWAADVYEGSPDPVTAFFMVPVKVAVLGFTLRFFTSAMLPASHHWQPLVAFSAFVSLIWGCFAALTELNTKRFFAYASINQIGFLLIGLATASLEGYRATFIYLVLYAIMNVGFLKVFLSTRRYDGRSLIYLTDFRNLGTRYPIFCWSIIVVMFSMAGVPPLVGFFGKYYLILFAQQQNLLALVICGLATSLISTYYYLRIVKTLWFDRCVKIRPVYYANFRDGLAWVDLVLWIGVLYIGLLSTVVARFWIV